MNINAARAIGVTTDAREAFAADVLAGLSRRQKAIPPKYFYDAEGSRLFEEITRAPEYYPTRTEIRILTDNAREIAALMPRDAALIEFGSGATAKVRILLGAGAPVLKYVPVDISGDFLHAEAEVLRRDLPDIAIHPVAADFMRPFTLPPSIEDAPRVGFFPGSTIGNFEPHEATAFLTLAARMLGPGGLLIIGADLEKHPSILNPAYNDAAGVTARFNLNLLRRANRELGADFDLAAFQHHAFYRSELRRVEMHLASRKRQIVRVLGRSFVFGAGETIHTENSHKFTVEGLQAMAGNAGLTPRGVWTDVDHYFAVQAFDVAPLSD
jgi:dimethylhistidine N-methyltransferase